MLSEDMQIRNFSPNTQLSYIQQVSLFARHFDKSPEILGSEDIRTYQLYLTKEKKLDASSILIALAALRFLYRVDPPQELDIRRCHPPTQEAAEVAYCSKPGGSSPVS